MKISLDLDGPHGKMWELAMTYHKLPEVYAWEIASVAVALASYIEHTVGGATDEAAAYSVAFHCVPEGAEPKLPEGVKGQVKADRLLYSQAVAIQDAGIQLLEKLQQSAHMEIASGQRT